MIPSPRFAITTTCDGGDIMIIDRAYNRQVIKTYRRHAYMPAAEHVRDQLNAKHDAWLATLQAAA